MLSIESSDNESKDEFINRREEILGQPELKNLKQMNETVKEMPNTMIGFCKDSNCFRLKNSQPTRDNEFEMLQEPDYQLNKGTDIQKNLQDTSVSNESSLMSNAMRMNVCKNSQNSRRNSFVTARNLPKNNDNWRIPVEDLDSETSDSEIIFEKKFIYTRKRKNHRPPEEMNASTPPKKLTSEREDHHRISSKDSIETHSLSSMESTDDSDPGSTNRRRKSRRTPETDSGTPPKRRRNSRSLTDSEGSDGCSIEEISSDEFNYGQPSCLKERHQISSEDSTGNTDDSDVEIIDPQIKLETKSSEICKRKNQVPPLRSLARRKESEILFEKLHLSENAREKMEKRSSNMDFTPPNESIQQSGIPKIISDVNVTSLSNPGCVDLLLRRVRRERDQTSEIRNTRDTNNIDKQHSQASKNPERISVLSKGRTRYLRHSCIFIILLLILTIFLLVYSKLIFAAEYY